MNEQVAQHNAETESRITLTPGQRRTLQRARWDETVGDDRSWWASVRHGLAQYRSHRHACRTLAEWDAELAQRIDGNVDATD